MLSWLLILLPLAMTIAGVIFSSPGLIWLGGAGALLIIGYITIGALFRHYGLDQQSTQSSTFDTANSHIEEPIYDEETTESEPSANMLDDGGRLLDDRTRVLLSQEPYHDSYVCYDSSWHFNHHAEVSFGSGANGGVGLWFTKMPGEVTWGGRIMCSLWAEDGPFGSRPFDLDEESAALLASLVQQNTGTLTEGTEIEHGDDLFVLIRELGNGLEDNETLVPGQARILLDDSKRVVSLILKRESPACLEQRSGSDTLDPAGAHCDPSSLSATQDAGRVVDCKAAEKTQSPLDSLDEPDARLLGTGLYSWEDGELLVGTAVVEGQERRIFQLGVYFRAEGTALGGVKAGRLRREIGEDAWLALDVRPGLSRPSA